MKAWRIGGWSIALALTAWPAAAADPAPPPAGAAAPRPAVIRCEPWVTDAYNNAFSAEVGRRRPGTEPPLAPCNDWRVGGKEAELRLPFLNVDEYVGPSRKADADDTVKVRTEARRIRLNEIVVVRVQHLQTLWERAQCLGPAKTADCTVRPILLFLENRPIVGLEPEAVSIDTATQSGTLRYHLERTEASKEVWADLLGLDLQGADLSRDVKLSVGFQGSAPLPSWINRFHLTRIRGLWLTTWVLIGGLLLYGFYRALEDSDLLRDRYPHVELGGKRPFSLAHCLGAWWGGLILYALAFIWLVTGQRDFSTTALALLGITAGTVMGARLIDVSRNATTVTNDPAEAPRQAAIQLAVDSKTALETAIEAARDKVRKNDPAGPADLMKALTDYQAFLATTRRDFPELIAPPSRGLLIDVLSDAQGVSFHRFQMAAWAAILGLMFVVEVLGRLAMPVFEPNLLALLGLSSGTYLGLKIPEK